MLSPVVAFFSAHLALDMAGILVPPFAFAFTAIAWSGRITGTVGRLLTAASCTIWVYARSPTSVALVLTPLEWSSLAGLEVLGLIAVARLRRRREATDTVNEGEQRYRTLVQTSSAIVWRVGGDGHLIELAGWEKLSSGALPHPTRDAWLQLVHPEDLPAVAAAWDHARDLAEPVSIDCRLQVTPLVPAPDITSGDGTSPSPSSATTDGEAPPANGARQGVSSPALEQTYRHVRVRGVPLRDQDGRVREWIGTGVDIHEQKQVEEALRRKEAELTTLVNAVPGLVFYIDRDYRYRLNNETFRSWFGLEPAGLRGRRVEEIIGPAAFERVKSEIDQALAGKAAHFETWVPYLHGGARWIEAHLTPHRAEDGQIHGCIGLVHDIAERKRREQEHHDALARYQFLADAMPQIVWTALPDGRIDYINWRWLLLTECPIDRASGTYAWLETVHPEDREATLASWQRALACGETFEVQHRIRRASDNAYLWHLSRAVARRDERGNIVQWVGSSTDIDQQCRAYAELAAAREELRQHAASLEARIRERTASLEDANAELRILTTSVSHDLRTPLHIIQGFIDEIAADRTNRLSSESTELLDRVGYTTKRMAKLMQDLLGYTGISHASQHLRDLPLSEIVSEVLEQHRDSIHGSDTLVTVQHPLHSVRADATGAFQVLSNLISNALKFAAPARPLRLRIRTEITHSRVRLWVEDNGIGIDGRDQERIFRLFERLDGAKGHPGNGVGLALVRKAMSRMGGAAGVMSQPGYGSSFWVEFQMPQSATSGAAS